MLERCAEEITQLFVFRKWEQRICGAEEEHSQMWCCILLLTHVSENLWLQCNNLPMRPFAKNMLEQGASRTRSLVKRKTPQARKDPMQCCGADGPQASSQSPTRLCSPKAVPLRLAPSSWGASYSCWLLPLCFLLLFSTPAPHQTTIWRVRG